MGVGLAFGLLGGLALSAVAQPVAWQQEGWQAGMHWTWEVCVPQTAPFQLHAYVLNLERLLHCETGVLAIVSEEAGWVQLALVTFLRRPGQWPPYWDLVPDTGTLPPFFGLAAMLPNLYPWPGFQVTRAEEHLWGRQLFQVKAAEDPRVVRLVGERVVVAPAFEVQHFAAFEFEGEDVVSRVEEPPPELADRISVEAWREGLVSLVELLERGLSQRWELAVSFEVGWPVEIKVYLQPEEGGEKPVWEARLVGIEVLPLAEVRARLQAALEHAVYPTNREAVLAALQELLPAP